MSVCLSVCCRESKIFRKRQIVFMYRGHFSSVRRICEHHFNPVPHDGVGFKLKCQIFSVPSFSFVRVWCFSLFYVIENVMFWRFWAVGWTKQPISKTSPWALGNCEGHFSALNGSLCFLHKLIVSSWGGWSLHRANQTE